jgi:hypothetical protein
MKNIDIKITSKEIKTEIRTLRSKWTREMVNDLSSYGNIDEIYRKNKRKRKIIKIFENLEIL